MSKFETITEKFQEELGLLCDEYAERLSMDSPEEFQGDEKDWGNSHLMLLHLMRDFAEGNFLTITDGQLKMAPFDHDTFEPGDE